MLRTDVIVIGGGQAGLAMSRCLVERGIDHVVLERGRTAERWRSERWDSLRLLSPSWMARLPGWRYQGADPDGYMAMPEVIDYLERYARSFAAPVVEHAAVQAVTPAAAGYRVITTRGDWRAPCVVLATGACDLPRVPALAGRLAPGLTQLHTSRYRRPGLLPDGGVLVVGASASGVQIADELARAGRAVTLAVGRHTRLPRRYRGRDILWWLDALGLFDATPCTVRDLARARRQPSWQLAGRPDRLDVDLPALAGAGVRLAGRLADADGRRVSFADDLAATTATADAALARLRGRIDALVDAAGAPDAPPAPPPPEVIRAAAVDAAPRALDLDAEGIGTIIWATGYRRAYPWLQVPVVGADGELRHDGGVTPAPGLYALGLPFMRRRRSSFIDGVGDDARELAEHIVLRLAGARRQAAA
jgi:putative flavoprotein involved in K+ transport